MKRREFIGLLLLTGCTQNEIKPMRASRIMSMMFSNGIDQGQNYLINSARAYWDFRGNGQCISVPDLTSNGHNLMSTTSPFSQTFNYYTYTFWNGSQRQIVRAFDYGPFLPAGNQSLFHNDFEFHLVLSGRKFQTNSLAGVDGFTSNNNFALSFDGSGGGYLTFTLNFGGSDTVIKVTDPILEAGSTKTCWPMVYIRCQIDFTNDTFRVWINGGEVATTFVSGTAISSWGQTSFTQSGAYGFGVKNHAGVVSGSSVYYNDLFHAAFTDKLNNEQAYNIAKFFLEHDAGTI